MIGLYRPNILLLNQSGGLLKRIFSKENVHLLLANNLEEAQNLLDLANIDIIVAVRDKNNLNWPDLLSKIPPNISIIVVDNLGGVVPEKWKERSDIFLRESTAQESLIKICNDLLEQRRSLKIAA